MKWKRLFKWRGRRVANAREPMELEPPTRAKANIWKTCHIDIIDKCNLHCPTCVRGTRFLKNSDQAMAMETFRSIVRKAKDEGYHGIGLFNWIEPFLCRTIEQFVVTVKQEGLYCGISSNLSLKPDIYLDPIGKALAAGLDHLIVSVSGYRQEVYEINHVGGNIAWVKANLEGITRLRREGSISSLITLKFIRFDYNSAEEAALRAYADRLGTKFEMIEGVGHPARPQDARATEEHFSKQLAGFRPSRAHEKSGELCPLISDLAIDSKGDAYLCCAFPYHPTFRIGPYLEMSKEELLLQRYTHPFCTGCNFPRRKATQEDCDEIVKALKARFTASDKVLAASE